MTKEEKENIQPTLDMLIFISKNEDALKEVTQLGSLENKTITKNTIVGMIRYLININDDTWRII